MSAPKALRVLLLEDNPTDVELTQLELERAGFRLIIDVVESAADFEERLESHVYDVILADHNLPQWTGMDALALLRSRDDMPFILVTGSLGEETAVEYIRNGASDYVIKDRLTRLPFAIRRALDEREHRAQRKRAEAALRESDARYRELFENGNDIVFMQDIQGNLTALNKAGEVITGYKRDEALGTMLFETLAPAHVETMRSAMMRHLAGEPSAAFDIEILSKDGRRVALEVVSRAVFDHGRPVGMQAIARDVTERQRLELDLRQAQKMEAVGQLAGGVAHDFNNLLTVIRGYSSLLIDQFEESDWRRHAIQEMDKAADRAATLTRQLLAFSRRQVLKPAIIDLNLVIADMTSMLRRLIPEDIKLVADLDPELGTVRADAGQMEQVLLNLAVNARDAMPGGGRLVIETANLEAGEILNPGAAPSPYVALSVRDTGIGMDAATKARIFEPFFTTKERGKGTGLGLATVYGIVQQSGGFIEVESAPGEGASFRIVLPRSDDAAESDTLSTESAHGSIAPATILLVEDDRAVRRLAQHCLEGQGYKVLPAGSCAEALRIAADNGNSVHLLVTDVVMPDMNGRELAERLSSTYPHLKIIFMSGYMDKSVSEGLVDDTAHFLQKPFRPVDLNRKVRDVLARQK